MSRNVFILGAGASVEAGAPLMGNFLDVANALNRSGVVPNRKDAFDLVEKGRSALQGTYGKMQNIDLHNLEAVLSAFEMSQTLGVLADLKGEEIDALPRAYRKVIATTLEQTIRCPVEKQWIGPPKPYWEFVELISKTRMLAEQTSMITLNYDLCADFALYKKGVEIDYCLSDTSVVKSFKLMKLHGSLNWSFCETCNLVYPLSLKEFFNKYQYNVFPGDSNQRVILDVSSKLGQFQHRFECPMRGDVVEPFIVPPTWNKSKYHVGIEKVWRHAALELQNAENIFVVGYSLPKLDQFFSYLFAIGLTSKKMISRFWVVDPDVSVGERYMELLSPPVRARFRHIKCGFGDGIKELSSALRDEQ